MLKVEKEYNEKYGDVPKTSVERLNYLIDNMKSKKSLKGRIISEIQRIMNIKWEKFSYVIYMVPKGSPRPRSSKGHFYVKGAADNKKLFEKFAMEVDVTMITTPCKMIIRSYLPIPTSMKAYEQILAELGYIRPISTPDFDNLAKTYADMIKGTLIYDDALIVKGVSEKFYSVKPRIEIDMYYMEEYDSEYNRKKIIDKL